MNYSIKGDLSSKEVGGELFIYNRKDSTISSFNGTGAFIWGLLNKGFSFDKISRRLCEEYDVLPAKAAEDVSDFIKNLGDNGLITFLPE
ncbi:MAG: PqqD family protein [Chitinivibrionales bacterium]